MTIRQILLVSSYSLFAVADTLSQYADAHYICSIISALGCATISSVPPERGEFIASDANPALDAQDSHLLGDALSEVDRYRSMDRLIPTYHNIVSVAVIEVSLIIPMCRYESLMMFSSISC